MFALVAVVLANAHVLTMAPGQPHATVLAVAGERLVYVGDSLAAARKAAGPAAEVIDLGGHTVVPGFDDAHVHFGLSLTIGSDHGVDVPDGPRRAWMRAVERASAAHPDGEWLFVKTPHLPAGVARARDLDFVTRPLFVVTSRGGLINHRGLQLAGFTTDEAPDGFIRGRALAAALERLTRGLPAGRLRAGARALLAELARNGITSVQLILDELPDLFDGLRRSGELSARVRLVPLGYRFDNAFYQPSWNAPAPEWVRVDGVKYFHDDGARLSRFELEEIVDSNARAGRPVVVHVLSGHALDTLLDGIEAAAVGHPELLRLFRLEHVDEASPAQARRLARLGIAVCTNPSMMPEWHRASAFPLATLHAAGVALCIGSDYVGAHAPPRPLAPLDGIQQAVTHGGLGGKEAVGPDVALAAYTLGSAAAEGQAAQKGSLEVGKWADLAVLSDDPTAVAPDHIGAVSVLLTMVGGRVVYRRDGWGESVDRRRPPPPTIGPPAPHPPTTIGPVEPPKRP